MATVNLFYDAVFRDGAFTSNDPRVRAYAVQKTLRAMDLGGELGAKIFVLWGGREGTETDACRRPDEAITRLREAINYLCEYSLDRKYGYRFALEASRTSRAGTSTWPRRARLWGSSRHSPTPRWSASISFRPWPRRAYRTEDYDGVRDFARGCMTTYLILKKRAEQWNADPEIQALVHAAAGNGAPCLSKYSPANREKLMNESFDRASLATKGLAYERLDQLTMEVLLGVR